MKKITKATYKSFIKKNRKRLYVILRSEFNGMIDGCEDIQKEIKKAEETTTNVKNSLGIKNTWIVNGGNDYFTHYEDNQCEGIEVSNCCGSFIVCTLKGEK